MAALGTRNLTLSIAAGDVTAQVYKVEVNSAEADTGDPTYAEAASGGARKYTLDFTAVQDLATGTLWDKVWSATGTTVAYLLKPYGNATASASQPHYSGNVVITEPDGVLIGGTADATATAVHKFDVSWVLTARPTKVTA